MNDLVGTGILEQYGREWEVQVKIDLGKNTVLVSHAVNDPGEALLHALTRTGAETEPTLCKLAFRTPVGDLLRDKWSGLFVLNARCNSGFNSDSLRILRREPESKGLAEIELQPCSSIVDFQLVRFPGSKPWCDAYYRVGRPAVPSDVAITIRGQVATVSNATDGVVIVSESSLFDDHEAMAWALAIFHGGPVSLRCSADSETLRLNLCPHDCRAYAALSTHTATIEATLQQLYDFYVGLSEPEKTNWRTASHYYLEGLTSTSVMEIRLKHLFSFLEVMDGSGTLNKTTMAPLLQISRDEAHLLAEMRNKLVHNGASLGHAYASALQAVRHGGRTASIKPDLLAMVDPVEAGRFVYFWLADRIKEYIRREIGFDGAWRSYERKWPASSSAVQN
jgi:hypothetical protein